MNEIVNNEKLEMAETLHNYVMQGAFLSAISLKFIFDNQLFQELGFETQKSYIEHCLPFNEKTAYKYLRIATIYGKAFYISFDYNQLEESVSSIALAKLSSKRVDNEVENFWSLGLTKLYMIASKTPEHIASGLVENGVLILNENQYTLSQLRKMTVKQLNVALVYYNTGKTPEQIFSDYIDEPEDKKEFRELGRRLPILGRYLQVTVEKYLSYASYDSIRQHGHEPNPKLVEYKYELEDISTKFAELIERINYIHQEVSK
ncbi:MAG: hypothetical protein HBSAPP04_14550 [Ignavibacteriaceae bacterium]|nr:MAG: hypothetical protein HBSAPP04_14550 [Ignavibacteriaceae bacterium]